MTAPLWENEEWEIYPAQINWRGKSKRNLGIEFSTSYVKNNTIDLFESCAGHPQRNPDLLYDAFLQLATLWDLQCNYDELRKIRDQAKQEKINGGN